MTGSETTLSLQNQTGEAVICPLEIKLHFARFSSTVENVDNTLAIRVDLANLSPHVHDLIHDPENLHGLSHKVVAVESVVYLAKQFNQLKTLFENLAIDQGIVDNYFSQVIVFINFFL